MRSTQPDGIPPGPLSRPVWSINEWDPLEEVIVGSVRGARLPHWDVAVQATMPQEYHELYRTAGGSPFPADMVERAEEQLDSFAAILERHGVVVRRPAAIEHGRPFATPDWSSSSGLYAGMPRDCLLVVGDTIIEVPMTWRSRYFETLAFRDLLTHYFREGARWISAPKPRLLDDQFASAHDPQPMGHRGFAASAITEHEPTFDAADFLRFGSFVIGQRSHVTNALGIDWLRRHAPIGRVEEIEVHDSHAMHIDTSLMPLAPGKLLVNRERVPQLPSVLSDWEPIYAPEPVMTSSHPLYMSSPWLSANVFSLDPTRVFVEAQELPLADELSRHGFEPIPVPFRWVNSFGGSFHCVTLDVRRRSVPQG